LHTKKFNCNNKFDCFINITYIKINIFYCLWHILLVCVFALSQFSNWASALSRQFWCWSLSGCNTAWYQ
jgi:hypothetical protein